MAASDKDTIYIDIDDEITGIIDKVKDSKGKVVALVLPKRAAVFQSIVNMKLLKRAADAANKHLVLITSEAGLLPLAGAAGVHVAKTLTSKPEIPTGPADLGDDEDEAVGEDELPEDEEPVDTSKSVGALAGVAGAAAAADGVETLVMDDEDLPPEADAAAAPGTKDFKPPKKDKKLAIPDFDRFRLLLIGGGLALLLLIFGFVFANSVLPKATILIKTDATAVDANANVNLSTTAKTLDEQNNILPAKLASTAKTYSQAVPTTGQRNNGNKASGDVGLQNCSSSDDGVTVPAGTGVSSGGNTYITQSTATLPSSSFTGGSHKCTTPRVNVAVLAQSGGSSYNLPGGASFTVAGMSSVNGQGGSISGGTDNIVRTVNQNDINGAKAKIVANDSELKTTLGDSLKKDSLYPLTATYSAAPPAVTSSANVGDVADNVTVTENVTYTMFGVHKDDLNKVVNNAIKDQIDTGKQSILDNGLDKATYNVDSMSATDAKLSVGVNATAGPDLNVGLIKAAAAGKKPGVVKDALKTNPDVTDVEVKLSPFWVSSVPKKTSKIKVVIAKPTAQASSSNGGQ
jgi:hypothetical protein